MVKSAELRGAAAAVGRCRRVNGTEDQITSEAKTVTVQEQE
jgi:hypothetical protein